MSGFKILILLTENQHSAYFAVLRISCSCLKMGIKHYQYLEQVSAMFYADCTVSFVVHFRLNLELRDNEGRVPLWLALSRDTRVDPMDEDCLEAKLVKHGASPDAINNITGERSLFGPSVFKMIHTIIVSIQVINLLNL